MRIIHSLLAFVFALTFLVGPVMGAQASETRIAPCPMHVSDVERHAPTKSPAHQFKSCIGCAPTPGEAASVSIAVDPVSQPFELWPVVWPLRAGLSFAPDPTPPRPGL